MDLLHWFVDFVLHIDKHLIDLLAEYKTSVIFIIALIIFCETGLVVTPILPGDSMIFAFGALVADPSANINVHFSALVFIAAAFLGNLANYSIGRFIGPKVYEKNYKLISRKYLDRTQKFFDKYGAMTIIYTRFAPILRTFAPFIAGVGQMKLGKFALYNFIGGFLWVVAFLYAGFFFGNITFVKEHFEIIVLGIILVSLIPAVFAFLKMRFGKKEVV
ncbi:MAG TPA: DedA family protein [Chitinophagales bacterium]|nr:DedA family protein [Chitinophagales bacterium]